jgi:hypothetical protein
MKLITKWLPLLATLAIGAVVSVASAATMKCTLTGKEVNTCCCEQKNGKPFCKLAKKEVDKCCCTGM